MEEAVRLREVTQKYPSPIIHLATGQLQKHRQNNTRKTENSQVEIIPDMCHCQPRKRLKLNNAMKSIYLSAEVAIGRQRFR